MTEPLHPLLRPFTMTPDQVADLVERTRASMLAKHTLNRPPGRWQAMSLSRVGARYMMLTGCSCTEAQKMFGVSAGAIINAVRRAKRRDAARVAK